MGTLPLPETELVVTPVPVGLTLELYKPTVAYCAVVAVLSSETFIRVRPTGCDALYPLMTEVPPDIELVDRSPLMRMLVKYGVLLPVAVL